ncbi:adenylyltransferase/cytidyltransferase family protein [Algisphaera agarilytica]|nr:adenylyltransferase/cytidyltransferase family protein [Algisphaera agarilytica]
MISGCFDLLHSGHVAFLLEAAQLGELYVCLGSDSTVLKLKGRSPVTDERERAYMVRAIQGVHEVRVSRGDGLLDFLPEIQDIQPDIFFVNRDGHSQEKQDAIEAHGVQYLVSERRPHPGLTQRSTTSLRDQDFIPHRIDLAGGWLDQPFINSLHPGPVIGCSIDHQDRYDTRSGMASSTRATAVKLWGRRLPVDDPEYLAKVLFAFENPPGSGDVTGSQDAISIVYPGITRMHYDGGYWPTQIDNCVDHDLIQFLQDRLYVKYVGARPGSFNVLDERNPNPADTKRLAEASEGLWSALHRKDASGVGEAMTRSFDAQTAMFPLMRNDAIDAAIAEHEDSALGYKVSGAGGGGYVIFFSEQPIADASQPRLRGAD